MTSTQTFIEKAIAGGYEIPGGISYYGPGEHSWGEHFFDPGKGEYGEAVEPEEFMPRILLDPLAWQAVGKVEGWHKKMVVRRGVVIGNFAIPKERVVFDEIEYNMDYIEGWSWYMHRMIDALAEGTDIESFLASTLNLKNL